MEFISTGAIESMVIAVRQERLFWNKIKTAGFTRLKELSL